MTGIQRLRTLVLAILLFVPSSAGFATSHLREQAQSWPQDLQSAIGARNDSRSAQLSPLTSDWFVGAWETRNIEFGRDVTIIWTLWDDGRLAYDFVVDDVPGRGSTGTWAYRDGVMQENWVRPDGSTGEGRGSVEKIDDHTLRLTIADNGTDSYRGIVRIYRRLGPPQVVDNGGAVRFAKTQ